MIFGPIRLFVFLCLLLNTESFFFSLDKYHCHPCFQSGEQQFFHYADGLCWIVLQKMSHNKIIKHMFGSNLPASKLDLDVRKKFLRKRSGLLWQTYLQDERRKGKRKNKKAPILTIRNRPKLQLQRWIMQLIKKRECTATSIIMMPGSLAKRSRDFPHSVCHPTAFLASNNRRQQCQLSSPDVLIIS